MTKTVGGSGNRWSILPLLIVVALATAGFAYAVTCDRCGEEISGRYYHTSDGNFHPACYQAVRPRCAITGRALEGSYYQDYWGNRYHATVPDLYPECRFCGRFISENLTDGGVELDNGDFMCNLCAATVIDNPREARQLVANIADSLRRDGIDVEDVYDIEIKLCPLSEIQDKLSDYTADPFGLAESNRFVILDVTLSESYTIWLYNELPYTEFISTAAHELMHVWIYQNDNHDLDPAFEEGSCNYASYLVLERFDPNLTGYVIERLERNVDEIYGEGYRRVAALVEERGIDHWLGNLSDNRYLPAGF